MATLLSAFSITAFADDNAQSGSGDTHGAASGYAWYNTYQYLWKVTLFVGKSDQASKSSNLQNDFHRIGTVVMKKTGWNVSSSVKFGSGTKVDYYSGAAMTMDTSPKIISDANCPKVPKNTVYALIKEGRLGAIRVGRSILIPKTALVEMIVNEKNYIRIPEDSADSLWTFESVTV